MVKAGDPTDAVINELADAMEEGDIIIDGGNALYTDTIRREKAIRERGLHFVGAGISGGEEGALNGPSIMPGGPAESYKSLGPLLEEISAHVDGVPCCTHIGPDGAGHFVKMVHNGIEYSDMQLIGEAYQLLRDGLGKTAGEIADVFDEWNKGDLDSFLVEITAEVLRQTDAKTGKPLVDVILDEAEQKGTGRWTVKSALDLGVPVTGIAEAVFARALSGSVDPAQGHHRAGLGRAGRQAQRRSAVHRGRPAGPVRVEDHRLRAGLQPDSGRQRRIRLGHHARRPGHDLARRLHHPGQVPQPDQRGVRRRRRPADADRRAVLPQRHRSGDRRLAPGGGDRHAAGYPDSGVLVSAVLLRRAAHRAAAGRADPGPAGLLRRAHLRPHRRGPEQEVPHPVERRPNRSICLSELTNVSVAR